MQLTLIVRAFYDEEKARKYVGHHKMNEFGRVIINDLDKVKSKEYFISAFMVGAERLWEEMTKERPNGSPRGQAVDVID